MALPKTTSTPARLPAAARVHKPQVGTAERRREIVKAAMRVFATRGFHNASLVEIAEEVGMTHSGVIHHFGNKQQLLVEVLTYRDDLDVMAFEGHRPPKGQAFLEHLIDTAMENSRRPGIVQGYTVLSSESVTEGHPAQTYFRERFVGLREMLVEALRIVTDAQVDDEELDNAASAIIATMDGLQVQWLHDRKAVDMPRALRLVIRGVLRELVSVDG